MFSPENVQLRLATSIAALLVVSIGCSGSKTDDNVAAALIADLAHNNVDLSDHRLRKKMDEEMIAAITSVRAGK